MSLEFTFLEQEKITSWLFMVCFINFMNWLKQVQYLSFKRIPICLSENIHCSSKSDFVFFRSVSSRRLLVFYVLPLLVCVFVIGFLCVCLLALSEYFPLFLHNVFGLFISNYWLLYVDVFTSCLEYLTGIKFPIFPMTLCFHCQFFHWFFSAFQIYYVHFPS